MSDLRIVPIDPHRLAAMRAAGTDERGNPWTRLRADGNGPLRCCLRQARTGEDIALINYSPWTERSPWAEAGPVFVHHAACAGYPTPERYPDELRNALRLLRPYDHDGAIAYAHARFLQPDDDPEAVLTELLAHPDVEHVHVRSGDHGCFTFEVRRAGG